MVIDIFLILIVLTSLYVLIKILFGKFPILSHIKIEQIHKEKEKRTKSKILEKRFFNILKNSRLKNLLIKFSNSRRQKIGEKIYALEKRYLDKYNEIVKTEPREVEKRIDLVVQEAKKKLEENNFQEAESKFTEVLSLDPRNLVALNNLLKIYLYQKKYHLALKTAKHTLQLNKQAIKWWGKFRKKDEKIPEKLLNKLVLSLVDIGYIYQEQDNRAQALKYFAKAVKYNPHHPRLLDFLIENYIVLGKKEEASNYLTRIKEINPENQKIAEWEEKIKNLPKSPDSSAGRATPW